MKIADNSRWFCKKIQYFNSDNSEISLKSLLHQMFLWHFFRVLSKRLLNNLSLLFYIKWSKPSYYLSLCHKTNQPHHMYLYTDYNWFYLKW